MYNSGRKLSSIDSILDQPKFKIVKEMYAIYIEVWMLLVILK